MLFIVGGMAKGRHVYAAKHEFAFYKENLKNFIVDKKHGESFVIEDEELYHRVVHVVRLSLADECILFDAEQHVVVSFEAVVSKKALKFLIHECLTNIILRPTLDIYLPLLKREALEQAIYSCVELGASSINLVITAQVQRSWHVKDMQRLTNIIIAAAEQSKQFVIPTLHSPISMDNALAKTRLADVTCVANKTGSSLLESMVSIRTTKPAVIAVWIGPEGDFTSQEVEDLKPCAQMIALTPTVLRSQQALALLVGAIRSV